MKLVHYILQGLFYSLFFAVLGIEHIRVLFFKRAIATKFIL